MEIRLEQLRKDYEPYKAQEDLNTLLEVFPQVAENLRMVQFCKGIGLAVENIKELFTGKEVTITGKLHSSEHEKYFDVQDAKLQLYKEKKNPDKLHLSLNGQNIIDWFKEQFNKVKQTIKPHISPAAPKEKKGRGI